MNNPPDPERTLSSPFKISAEDQRLIQECNRESFYSRCLPFSTALGGITFFAVKAGYLSGSPSWGPTPKVLGAVFFGYFLGKISYQQICAEKLMANPNSQLGASLRAKRQQGGGGFQDSISLDIPGYTLPDESSRDVYRDDAAPRTFTDLDTDRPYNKGLDDTFRLNVDSPQRPEDFVLPPQASTPNTYDELRRRNREEFESRSRGYSGRPAEDPQRQYQPPSKPSTGAEDAFSHRSTNVYGDIFEK